VQLDFWENERDKNNQHRVELALLGFDGQEVNQPHSPMINWWFVSNIGFGRSGCYLSMLIISLRPGITKNPNHLLPGTSLGFETNIGGDEKGGFKVAKVNLSLPD
jgi:hypothetical protein